MLSFNKSDLYCSTSMMERAISTSPPARRRGRKADRVADAILDRVVSGSLPAGSILPKEDLLAEEFGVNRGVVREAIKLLEVHELVRPVRRLGTLVLDPHLSTSPAVLSAMLEPKPGTIDKQLFFGPSRDPRDTRCQDVNAGGKEANG